MKDDLEQLLRNLHLRKIAEIFDEDIGGGQLRSHLAAVSGSAGAS